MVKWVITPKIGYNPLILSIDPIFLGHPAEPVAQVSSAEPRDKCAAIQMFHKFGFQTHRIHGAGIYTYMKTIKINHSYR